jgi:2-methylisocitrate lyase-like PEP mutase family enzyme
MSVSAPLRELLAAPAILEQPVVCDPLGARAAADAGYQAVTLPGYAIGAHLPGDRLLSVGCIERAVQRIAESCGVPVMLDADTGWDVPSALGRFAAAGAAAVHLNSPYLPSSVPFHAAVDRRRAHDHLLIRVRAAAGCGADVVIAARCDIDDADGYGAALDRGGRLLEAGVDALVVHSADDTNLAHLAADLPDAWLIYSAVPALPSSPVVHPVAQLQTWGYAAVSNKYHHCYCARTAPRTATEDGRTRLSTTEGTR